MEALPLDHQVEIVLGEGEWYHGQINVSELVEEMQPLAVSVRVVRATQCSEGTNEDLSCRFGLKVFGSTHGSFITDNPEAVEESASRQDGGSYAMVASACELRHALDHSYHISIWG